MPVTIRVVERMPRGGGSDHVPFNRVGVPGFFWRETGRANYRYVHHTQHDSFDQAIPEYLVQSSVAAAVTAYNLACAETLLPRQPAPPPLVLIPVARTVAR
ncbi:MAG: M28 family peptidase [Armatimonadetes bacterium]|nr:M28 family peptidase [Armatimonadota bacterium]